MNISKERTKNKMKVSKVSRGYGDNVAKKGEIIGMVVQAGSKTKNHKAPTIFAQKYKKKVFGYFLVKSVGDSTLTIMNLDTKVETVVERSWLGTGAFLETFQKEVVEFANKINLGSWYHKEENDENTHSVTVSIYPSFVVTSLSNSVMQDDGTFTFSIDNVDGVHLDKVARYKEKTMLRYSCY